MSSREASDEEPPAEAGGDAEGDADRRSTGAAVKAGGSAWSAPPRILAVVRAALGVAIMASAMLENDYRHMGDPAFCGVASPCFKLRTSDEGMRFAIWLAPYHLTLPQVGLLGFVALMAISFFVKTRTYLQAFTVLTTFAGAAALYLIVVQAQLHTFCPYCMTVDTSTLIAGVASLVLMRALPSERALERSLASSFSAPVTFSWGAVAAAAIALPYVWAEHPSVPPLPAPIAKMQAPGKLTVVSITDFQCPHCRHTAPLLTKLRERPDVDFHRLMAPLPFHPGAEPAARAYLCAPEDKANDLAEALYAAPDLELTPEWAGAPKEEAVAHYSDVAVRVGKGVGLDEDAMTKCMASDETTQHLKQDRAVFDEVGGQGLPTTFVGREEIVGYDPEKIERAAGRAGSRPLELPVPLLYVAVGGLIAAAFALSWRRASGFDTVSS